MKEAILVVNAGLSTLKISIFTIQGSKIGNLLYKILLEIRDNKLLFHVNDGTSLYQISTEPIASDVISCMFNSFENWWQEKQLD